MRRLLAIALVVQAGFLFFHLDLLPVWTDERGTVVAAPEPPAQILETVSADVHPPLYLLVAHGWAKLPIPGTLPVRLRALSVLFALLSTIAVYLLFLRRETAAARKWFLLLWVFSPCLLLYARMARSYTLQLLLAMLTFYAFERLLESVRPAEAPAEKPPWPGTLAYSAGAALSLYTHYSTGAAVLAGCSAVLAWRWLRDGNRRAGLALAGSLALVAAALLPWALAMQNAIARWAGHHAHGVQWSSPAEHAVKIAFTGFSLAFGETMPVWGLALTLVAVPLVGAACVAGARSTTPALWIAGLVAYLAVSHWATFPFVPGRLLFLLPFLLAALVRYGDRAPVRGRVLCGALAVLYAGSAYAYFTKTGFLNKAYAAPLDEMAELANRGAPPSGTLFVVDYYNSDTLPFVDRLRKDVPLILIDGDESTRRVLAAADAGTARIWYWRNMHDVSPGRLHERLEAELTKSFQVRSHLFLPYGEADRLVMRLLGWPTRPTHLYQLLEFRRPPQ